MYGRTLIFVENFHVNNLSIVLEIFHAFNFRGTRPRNLFNLEHFPIYATSYVSYVRTLIVPPEMSVTIFTLLTAPRMVYIFGIIETKLQLI